MSRRQWLQLAAVGLAGVMGRTARADMFDLKDTALAAIRENHWIEPLPHSDGKGFFIEGSVIVPRDATDQPALPYPARYFMFRPLKGAFTPTDVDGKPKPEAKEVRLEFNWTRTTHLEIDTLDDVRSLISNRDLRYNSGAEALDALLAEVDPDGALHLKASVPSVADPTIVPREGSVSQFLIYGVMSALARQQAQQTLRGQPASDPLSYSPLDGHLWGADWGATTGSLLRAIARCDKWGEFEPGVRASCFALARFLSDRLFVNLDNVAPGGKEKAQRVYGLVWQARNAVFGALLLGSPNFLGQPPKAGEKSPADRLLTPLDDLQPVSNQDEFQVALQLVATWAPRTTDVGRLTDLLIGCASGRADFQAAGAPHPLSANAANAANASGSQAFDVLLRLAAAPAAGAVDTGAAFRQRLRNWVMVTSNDAPSVHAAREVFVRAGLADDAEIQPTVTSLVGWGAHARVERDDIRQTTAYMLKHLPASIADAGRRARYQAELDRQIQGCRESYQSGYFGRETGMFLDVYDKTQ